MTEHQTFGAIDRQAEDAQIHHQPPVNAGNPRGSSLADRLKAKFAGRDKQRVTVIEGHTRAGESIWLGFDKDVTEAELKRFREAGLNRAGRRNKSAQLSPEDVSNQASAARAINEKNLYVWDEAPQFDEKTGGWVGFLEDEDGDPLTVHSEEWLAAVNATRDPGAPEVTDPEDGLVELFGFAGLIALFEEYDAEVAGKGARVVDPTRATSGG